MIPLLSAQQMRTVEQAMLAETGLSSLVLMENAGRAVVSRLLELEKQGTIQLTHARVFVFSGPGKNGADGMVVARQLHNLGVDTLLFLSQSLDQLKKEALVQYQAARACQVPIVVCHPEEPQPVLQQVAQAKPGDVLIDALFGIGFVSPMPPFYRALIQAINQSPAPTLSVDIPSGLDPDVGLPAGISDDAPLDLVVRAFETVTFSFPKQSLCHSPGFLYTGHLTIAQIGIPSLFLSSLSLNAYLLDESCLRPLFQPLHSMGHKGTHGHLLLLAGSRGKSGAALLAAMGATALGVGLCTLACPFDIQTSFLSSLPEWMTLGYPAFPDDDSSLSQNQALSILTPHMVEKNACVIGPGISTHPMVESMLWSLLSAGNCPVVLDADALFLIAKSPMSRLQQISARRPLILTPHPLEAARLLQTTASDIQSSRSESAKQLAIQTGAMVVLKGPRTIVAIKDPSKSKDDVHLAVCDRGNPAMGTGGMGDVLAGMIGALLARGIDPYHAACAAVFLHATTGDSVASKHPKGFLLRPQVLCESIQDCLKQLDSVSSFMASSFSFMNGSGT